MQSFIVLGIIPGTNLELTFNYWVYTAALLVGMRLTQYAWQHRAAVRVWLVARQLANFIDRYQFQVPA